jgi:hypothetical protein
MEEECGPLFVEFPEAKEAYIFSNSKTSSTLTIQIKPYIFLIL